VPNRVATVTKPSRIYVAVPEPPPRLPRKRIDLSWFWPLLGIIAIPALVGLSAYLARR
jgi:hypothetical protein